MGNKQQDKGTVVIIKHTPSGDISDVMDSVASPVVNNKVVDLTEAIDEEYENVQRRDQSFLDMVLK